MSFSLGSAHGEISVGYDGSGVAAARKDLTGLQSVGGDLGKTFTTMGGVLAGVGAAFGVPLALAEKGAIGFGKNMANVNSILQLSDDQIASLGDQVQGLSQDVNKGPTELAAALYDIASSGFSGSEGLDILTASAKAANAGLTDTATSAAAIDAVLNSYGESADQAGHVSDILFQTVADGVLTFDQLANNMGNTLPVASSLGISLEELGAAYAQMTLQGVNASAAETQIAGLMRAALNPTTELTNALAEQGTTAEELIANGGLPAFLEALDKAAGGSKEEMFKLLGSQEAMNAATILGKNGVADYNDELDRMQHASDGAGATQDALDKQMQSTAFQMDRAQVAWESFGTAIGEQIDPIVRQVARSLGDLGFALTGLPPNIQQFIALFGGAVAILAGGAGAALLAAGKIIQLGQALSSAGINVGKLAASLGVLGVAIGAGILAYETNFLGFRDAVDGALKGAGKAINTFGKSFQAAFDKRQAKGMNTMAAAVGAFGHALEAATGIDITDQMNTLATAIQAVADGFQFATDQGMNPFAAGLHAIAQGAAALGLDGLASKMDDFASKVQEFGNIFEQSFGTTSQQNITGLGAALKAFGVALSDTIGIDVTSFFDKLGSTVEVAAASFQRAIDEGINPLEAALIGVRDALSFLTGIDLTGFSNTLGDVLGAVRDVGAAIVSGDFSQIPDILGSLATSIGDALSGLAVSLTDWVLNVAAPTAMNIIGDLSTWLMEQLNSAGAIVDNFVSWALNVALPAVGSFVGDLSTWILGKLQGLATNVANFVDWTMNVGLPAVGAFIGDLGSWILDKLRGAGTVVSDFKDWTLNVALPAIGTFVGDLGTWIGGKLQGAKAIIDNFTNWVLNVGVPAAGAFFGSLAAFITEKIQGLRTLVSDFVDWTLNVGLPTAGEFVGDLAGWIQGKLAGAAIAVENFTGWSLGLGLPGGSGMSTQAAHSPLTTGAGLAGIEQFILDQLTAAAIAIEDFTGWNLTVTAPEGGVTIDGGAIKDSILTALHDAVTVSPDFVAGAKDAGQALGQALIDALSAGISAVFGASGGLSTQAAKSPLTGIGPSLGDAFAAFDEGFTTAIIAEMDKVGPQIQAKLGAWVEEKKAGFWQTFIMDPLKGLFDFATGTQTAEASGLDPAAMGTEVGTSLGTAFSSDQFISGVQAGLDALPAEQFAGIATALMTKINDAIGTALQSPTMTEGGDVTPGAGFGASIITNIANQLVASLGTISAEVFAPFAAGLMAKINEGVSAALNAAGTQGAELAGSGDIAPAGGGIGEAIVTNLANSLAASIAAAPVEAFAALGTALQAKISEALSAAMSTSASAALPGGGMTGTGGGTGGGIGDQIATMLATSITGADFTGFATAIQTQISTAITTAMTAIQTTISTSTNVWITTLITTFSAMAAAAVSGMQQIQTSVATGMQTITSVITAQSGVWGPAVTAAGTAMSGAMTASMAAMNAAVATGFQTITSVIQAQAAAWTASVTAAGAAMSSAMTAAMAEVTAAVTSGMAAATAAVTAGVAAMMGALNAAAGQAFAAGQAIGQGLASGLSSMVGAVQAAASQLASAATDAIAAAAQVASPSKITMQIGEDIGAGLALGMQGMETSVVNAANALAKPIFDAIQGQLETQKQVRDSWMTPAQSTVSDHQRRTEDLSSLGNSPLAIRVQSILDGQVLDDRIVETSIGAMTRVPHRGGRRNSRFSLAGA
jgi:TP901 family phage tail tape measure protein